MSATTKLPTDQASIGTWGAELNDFLSQALVGSTTANINNGLIKEDHAAATKGGKVGVGTATPTAKLHIKDTTDPVIIEGLGVKGATDEVVFIETATGKLKKGTIATLTNSSFIKFDQFAARPTNLTATDAGKMYLYTQTGNLHEWTGTVWKVYDTNGVLNVKDYGAIGNGTVNDQPAIQLCVDIAMYGGSVSTLHNDKRGYSVFLPAGNFKILDSIHIGYGSTNGFITVTMYGSSKANAGSGMATILDARGFVDRPAICVQGSRGVQIQKLTILGAGSLINAVGGPVEKLLNNTGDVSDVNTWIDPVLVPNNTRFTPYCAIAVDPRSGPRPAVSYPDVLLPSYVGATQLTQYNKGQSSDATFFQVNMSGFMAGICIQPCDYDANGDFMKMIDCKFTGLPYGVTIGNTNSRMTTIENCQFVYVHTGIATNVHGNKSGRTEAPTINCQFERSYQVCDIPNNTGVVSFINCYGEGTCRLGSFGNGTSAVRFPIFFTNCHFQLVANNGTQKSHLTGANITIDGGGYKIQDGTFFNIGSYTGTVRLINGVEIGPEPVTYQPYELLAASKTAHVIILYMGQNSKLVPMDFFGVTGNSFRSIPKAYLPSDPQTVQKFGVIPAPEFVSTYNKPTGAIVSITVSGKTITVTLNLSERSMMMAGWNPGGIFQDAVSNTNFLIRSRVGVVVIAEAVSNYNEALATFRVPYTPLAGGVNLVLNSSLFIPSQFIKGDFTAGSNIITNVGQDDGVWREQGDKIEVDDWMYVEQYMDRFWTIGGTDCKVTTIDKVARTITLTGTAVKTQAGRQLGYFVKKPIANV